MFLEANAEMLKNSLYQTSEGLEDDLEQRGRPFQLISTETVDKEQGGQHY